MRLIRLKRACYSSDREMPIMGYLGRKKDEKVIKTLISIINNFEYQFGLSVGIQIVDEFP